MDLPMHENPCAICGSGAAYKVKYPANFKPEDMDFAARKTPKCRHFRIVVCDGCGLTYSNPILDPEHIIKLYRESRVIDEAQIQNIRADYMIELKRAIAATGKCERLLEIGCSNGFFLKAALDAGVKDVHGVEPGRIAAATAPEEVRSRIVNDIFHDGLYPENSFDLVCCFQVLDHILEPNAFLKSIHRVLRPGGVFLAIHHNIRSWFPRVLGQGCPMYDVEHIYLFDPKTAAAMIQKHGFEVITIENLKNGYTAEYAVKMFPFPQFIRKILLSVLYATRMSTFRFTVRAGNMVTMGRKT
jgi:SAM-dependent methyltransferase